MGRQAKILRGVFALLLLIVGTGTGCTAFLAHRTTFPVTPPDASFHSRVPRELDKVSLPPYVIEPPDILMINATKIIPRPPYKLTPGDAILIRVIGTLPDQSIADAYFLDSEGKVDLGPSYGRVLVAGLTVDEAQAAIRRHLSSILSGPEVSVSLAASAGAQQVIGEHLVAMDGRVNLGTYGWVHVAGMTLEEAKLAIETQLAKFLDKPEVVVDVFAYNSKKYYIITQGAGLGDNVVPAPITGNETVLDGIAQVGGLSQLSSSKIWIARPAPNSVGCEQILPVNWQEISQGASTATNYQLMPGDRLYIAEDPLLRFNNLVIRVTQPWERLFGFVSLGTGMANRIKRFGLGQF